MSEVDLESEETRYFAWLPTRYEDGSFCWLRFYWVETTVEPDEPPVAWRAVALASLVALLWLIATVAR